MYTVKSIKVFPSMEGHGFNGNLYKDDQKIASFHNEGRGGSTHFDWVDDNEKDLFHKYCQGKTWEFDGKQLSKSMDIEIEDMVLEKENDMKLKRESKRKTFFRPDSQKETFQKGEWLSLNVHFSDDVKKYLTDEYGHCIILNEQLEKAV